MITFSMQLPSEVVSYLNKMTEVAGSCKLASTCKSVLHPHPNNFWPKLGCPNGRTLTSTVHKHTIYWALYILLIV